MKKASPKTLIVLTALLSVLPLLAQSTNRETLKSDRQPTAEQKIRNLEQEWADAVVHQKTNVIDRIQANEFRFTDPSGQVWTKVRALDFIASGRLKIESFDMSDVDVRLYGNTAVVTLKVVWTGSAGGADISGPQRMTDVFVERDGRWQCVISQSTRIDGP
jgi:ketosteroid isomerase-like protein